MKTVCYLGLGSNLRTPKRQLHTALRKLKKLPHTVLTRTSQVESTKPLSRGYQPQYCNLVVELKTALPPRKLHQYCIQIEKEQGRTRKKRWASRTLDIDILLYGQRTSRSKQLTLPHPRICERSFVYQPLLKLSGLTLEHLIKNQKCRT